MNTISKTHQRFSDRLRNPRVLENPEEILGPYTQDVLGFWLILDQLTEEQWSILKERYNDEVLKECVNTSHVSPKKIASASSQLTILKNLKSNYIKEINLSKIEIALLETCPSETLWATFELIGGLHRINKLTFIPLFLDL